MCVWVTEFARKYLFLKTSQPLRNTTQTAGSLGFEQRLQIAIPETMAQSILRGEILILRITGKMHHTDEFVRLCRHPDSFVPEADQGLARV